MRRLSLTLLLALACLIPTAAVAGRSTTGDGVFELRAANGTFILTGRGVLWGQIDKGSVRITPVDPSSSNQLSVSGGHVTRPFDDPTVAVYSGSNIHFRIKGGKYKLRFHGTGLDLTAIGVGTADLTASPTMLNAGDYALDGGKWLSVPFAEQLYSYGTQPPVAPPNGQ